MLKFQPKISAYFSCQNDSQKNELFYQFFQLHKLYFIQQPHSRLSYRLFTRIIISKKRTKKFSFLQISKKRKTNINGPTCFAKSQVRLFILCIAIEASLYLSLHTQSISEGGQKIGFLRFFLLTEIANYQRFFLLVVD